MALSPLNLPQSSATVSVSIIDTLNIQDIPISTFLGPPLEGFETFDGVAHSFLVSNNDRSIVFDLGAPKNWKTDFPPHTVAEVEAFQEAGAEINIDAYVSDILANNSVSLDSIEAVIWSHTHWDHVGRPSLFPNSTNLVMGPGVLDFQGVGYPLNETSPFLARELEGRQVIEVEFSADSPRIGGLQAHDYFGDGSFYLLDAPGHEVGHINGLARVTSDPDTFILMGADSFHHSSQLRPSRNVPLPEFVELFDAPESFPDPLPGKLFYPLHPSNDPESLPDWAANLTSPEDTPFMAISGDSPFARDAPIARDVLSKLQDFDADDRVFVVAAHDTSLRNVVDHFPATANDWKAKGWKEQGRWQFLSDLEGALHAVSPCHGIPARRSHAKHWAM